jgi:TolB protein
MNYPARQCASKALLLLLSSLSLASASAQLNPESIGLFEGHLDVGTVLHTGAAHFDQQTESYSVTGSGENMWFGVDDFQFVWKKMTGDVAISASIAFKGDKGNNHRKAVLMIRQSLDGNSPSVDVARHGDGLTSLQFRDAAGTDTREVQTEFVDPQRIRLEKRGDFFYAFAAGKDGHLHPAGASTKVQLGEAFYVGIGVSAHDKDDLQTAVFSDVKVESLAPVDKTKLVLYSTLETVPVASGDRRVAYVAQAHFEAPNWAHDGSYFLFNQAGGIYSLSANGGQPTRIDTGSQTKCNNDHGISPDSKLIAVSDSSKTGKSLVYTLPIAGGTPQQVTTDAPSYWHGWSPDGSTLAFTGQRGDNFDIYTIGVNGGQEKRLTTAPGLDDGPEYSPDGEWIYFNSERTGHMQIWRMHADGSGQQQVIMDETNDWFPHISPDGKWMVFLSYGKDVTGHPPDKDVELNLMSMSDKSVHVLAKLFGGQGTINVPSWSPDSGKVAFVSYEYLPAGPWD